MMYKNMRIVDYLWIEWGYVERDKCAEIIEKVYI